MKIKRNILGITGIRSEYDILSSVFRAVQNHPDLNLGVVATGAHLSPVFGNTIEAIRADGFPIADEIESLLSGDGLASRVKGLSIQLQGLIQSIQRIRPDMLLVLGDREEAISAALAGAYMNIAVAHIAGGDRVIGNVDDQVRHAVTKLAHLHFVTNPESYERVLRLGEQSFRVHLTGNPGLDRFAETPVIMASGLSDCLGFMIPDSEPFMLVIQHVISTEVEQAYEQMKMTLEAVKQLGIRTILIHPNSDAGRQQIVQAIREYENLPFLHISANIPRTVFVNLMRRAGCLLGNSSAGILEAPLIKLPVVNVGNRQKGRLHAENVQFVPHEVEAIKKAVSKALFDETYRTQVRLCVNPYGDGRSSQRIAEILAAVHLDKNLLIKDITY
ncbi:MAG: UDP-N-acetylglucosamine 2-epimerase (hydrolyzing) [Desulfobacteraceae bacterium]|nr:MAG: UDP-N-acetylglucosamine 2-epimerase (hydrolyzing) [Desulfobacteraceae bacterium]